VYWPRLAALGTHCASALPIYSAATQRIVKLLAVRIDVRAPMKCISPRSETIQFVKQFATPMRLARLRIGLAMLAMMTATISAHAQNRVVTTAADVAGCWVSVQLSDPLRKLIQRPEFQEPASLVMCFEEDGSLRTIVSSRPTAMHLAEVRQILAQLKSTMRYTIVRPGLLEQVLSGTQSVAWVANFTPRENTLLGTTIPEGALAMGAWDARQQKAVHWRYMVRVPE
jgi:hypothetical protein